MTTPLGEIVKSRRNQMNLTQEELAERVDKSQRWVSNLEKGDVKHSKITTLQALSKTLDVSLHELVIAAGLATTEEGSRQIVNSYDESVQPIILSADDPRVSMIDLLENMDKSEVDSLVSIVQMLIGRNEEVARRSGEGIGKKTQDELSKRRRSA